MSWLAYLSLGWLLIDVVVGVVLWAGWRRRPPSDQEEFDAAFHAALAGRAPRCWCGEIGWPYDPQLDDTLRGSLHASSDVPRLFYHPDKRTQDLMGWSDFLRAAGLTSPPRGG